MLASVVRPASSSALAEMAGFHTATLVVGLTGSIRGPAASTVKLQVSVAVAPPALVAVATTM